MRIFRAAVCAFVILLVLSQAALAAIRDDLRQRVEALQAGMPVEAGGTRLHAKAALPLFYEKNGFEPIWLDGEALRPVAADFVSAIAESAAHGLRPSDYHEGDILDLMNSVEAGASRAQLTDLELLLTDSYLLLGSHYAAGKINPETIDSEWFANRRNLDMAAILTIAVKEGTVLERLRALPPQQEAYQDLRNRLASYRAIEREGGFTRITAGPTLKPGMNDPRIKDLRWRLVQSGDLVGDFGSDDTLFDDDLRAALVSYQLRHGLAADGVLGKQTLASLNQPVSKRIEQILANLERWRWAPGDLGRRHVLVNIAGFELLAVEDAKVALRKRVIVGRDYRRTPVFSDRITYLVFNPTWTVPRKIAVNDKLPDLQKDPSKLVSAGFQFFQGWGDQQKRIDPLAVNWTKVTRQNFDYRLVQSAGPLNALGQVKFMFPNKFDVYLHDTPSRKLFAKEQRAFSSGCVRVQDPLDLAAFLLRGQSDWSREKIDAVTDSVETRTVELEMPVPVHITYWTSWVDETGVLQFRDDVYGRDSPLLAALAENPV